MSIIKRGNNRSAINNTTETGALNKYAYRIGRQLAILLWVAMIALGLFAVRFALAGFWFIPEFTTPTDINNFMMGFLQTLVAFFTLVVALASVLGFLYIRDSSVVAAKDAAKEAAESYFGESGDRFKKEVVEELYHKMFTKMQYSDTDDSHQEKGEEDTFMSPADNKDKGENNE